MRLPRPKFSLLTLLLLSCAAGAGMGVYLNSAPWVVERSFQVAKDYYFSNEDLVLDHRHVIFQTAENESQYIDLACPNDAPIIIPKLPVYVHFTPDGQWVLVDKNEIISDRTRQTNIELREAKSFGLRHQLSVPRHFSSKAFFTSADSAYLLHNEFKLTVWNLNSGELLVDLAGIGGRPCYPEVSFLREKQRVESTYTPRAEVAKTLPEYYQDLSGKVPLPKSVSKEPNQSWQSMFGVDHTCIVSEDGTRAATQPWSRNRAQVWDLTTLKKICDVNLPLDFELGTFTTQNTKLVINRAGRSLEFQLPASAAQAVPAPPAGRRPTYLLNEYLPTGKEGDVLRDLNDKGALKIAAPIELIPSPGWAPSTASEESVRLDINPFDFDNGLEIEGSENALMNVIVDKYSGKALFDFCAEDGELSRRVKYISKTYQRVITLTDHNSLQIWRRVRPEWWWGYFYLPETWLCIVFSLATLVSLFKTRARTT